MILVYRTWRAAALVRDCLRLSREANVSTWWGVYWVFEAWLDTWAPTWLVNAFADLTSEALVDALRGGRPDLHG